MAMAQATLSASLVAEMTPVSSEAAAIANLVAAYSAYAEEAEALTSILGPGVELGEGAMAIALVGMNTPGAGPAKFVAGLQAFWTGVAGGLTTSFLGATAISPIPYAGLLAALTPVWTANQALERSVEDAMDAIATAIHSQVAGGTVTTSGPTITPIT